MESSTLDCTLLSSRYPTLGLSWQIPAGSAVSRPQAHGGGAPLLDPAASVFTMSSAI
jgi:hypothetical protein